MQHVELKIRKEIPSPLWGGLGWGSLRPVHSGFFSNFKMRATPTPTLPTRGREKSHVFKGLSTLVLSGLIFAEYALESVRAESIALPLFGEWVLGPGGNCDKIPAKQKMTFDHDGTGDYVIWNKVKCVLAVEFGPDNYSFYVKNEHTCIKRGFPENFAGKYIEVLPGHLRVVNKEGFKHDMTDCMVH
jgi:hypothetical protein